MKTTTATKPAILQFSHHSYERFDVRSSKDRRKFCDRYIAVYTDNNGNEYCKAFEVKQGAKPNVPKSGTHTELNALEYQF